MGKHVVVNGTKQLVIRIKIKSAVDIQKHETEYIHFNDTMLYGSIGGKMLRELIPNERVGVLVIPEPVLPTWK
jgi:hypothetical protein